MKDITVEVLLKKTAQSLQEVGIDDSRREARLLLSEASGWSLASLIAHPCERLPQDVLLRVEALVARRRHHCPMGRLLRRREFWSLTFQVEPRVFEPRADSECLVEAALTYLKSRASLHPRLLDLGVGTGCLLLSVLSEVACARGVGVDRELDVCRLAARNADMLGLSERTQWIVGDWATALEGEFDLILCNPPYIAEGEMASLMPEVAQYDPWQALAGGEDGLACYRRILPGLHRILTPRGALCLEVGHTQAACVMALSQDSGWRVNAVKQDLAGHQRCLVLTR